MRRGIPTLLAATLVIGGCGQGAAEGPTIEGFGAVAAAVEQAETVRFEMRMDVSMGGTDLVMVGEGISDAASGDSVMALRVEGEQAEQFGTTELRVVGDRMFVHGPMAAGFAPGANVAPGQWVQLDVNAMAAMQASGRATMDVRQMLDLLRAADPDLEDLGREEIRGESLQGYRASVTTRAMLDQQGINPETLTAAMMEMQPPALREQAAEYMNRVSEAMLDVEQTIDVWLHDDGLPRRMTMIVDGLGEVVTELPGGEMFADASVTAQIDLLEYGVEVDVQPPPPDQVVTAT